VESNQEGKTMSKQISFIWLPLLLGLLSGCTQTRQSPQAQPSPSEPPTVTAPIHKAKQSAADIQQKAQEREQMNPEAQPQPSPEQSN
jgi:hypothetical protein